MGTEGQPQAPSAFGRYTLLERLAVGGMAEVFRAKITSSHGFEKILVVKRILPHLAEDPNFVAMFIDEAKLTAQLTHPKIVQVLDFGEVSGQLFTALEYIDGFDALGLLRVAAQKRVHVPRALAVFVVMEVLEALDYAHNARDMGGTPMHIVHRDISPSNIFISASINKVVRPSMSFLATDEPPRTAALIRPSSGRKRLTAPSIPFSVTAFAYLWAYGIPG